MDAFNDKVVSSRGVENAIQGLSSEIVNARSVFPDGGTYYVAEQLRQFAEAIIRQINLDTIK